MARVGKPWWWKARGRWAATIDGRRIVAPTTIGKADVLAVAVWYDGVRKAGTPALIGDLVADLCNAYLAWDLARVEAGERDSRTHHGKRSVMTRICKTTIGRKRLGAIPALHLDQDHVEAALLVWAAEGVSPGYRRELVASLKTVWAWAARRVVGREPRQILPTNRLVGLPLPKSAAVEARFATSREAADWLRWLRKTGANPDFILLQRCLVRTGARPSEWTRAKWSEIRWDSQPLAILVRREWKAARKTGKPRRIYLTPLLRRALWRRFKAADSPDTLIFVSPRGLQWTATNLAGYTARKRREAIADGVPLLDDGADRLTCYRWRHTAASKLLMAGVDIATVAELLGTSVAMIQKHYGHLLNSHLAAAAAKLAR